VKTNFESLNLALVRDEFNADMFDENLDNEQHIEEMMNRQAARAMKKTCNLHLTQLPMYRLAQVGGEGNEAKYAPLSDCSV
jgi:hypothetical protein